MDEIKQVNAGDLSVGYVEAGPANGPAALTSARLAVRHPRLRRCRADPRAAGFRTIVPFLRGYGTTTFLAADTPRNGQQAALGVDGLNLLDALGVDSAVVAGFDWGARTALVMAALWPERCAGLVSVSGYLIGNPEANMQPLPPAAELAWWYQFYFATERGRLGYERNTRDFNRLIWHSASPQWKFDDNTFERTAASFDNPDHVAIVIHNYRWRIGLSDGERRFDELEAKLAASPAIEVPTITMEGDANGAPHPGPDAYRAKFDGRYEHRLITGGIGHNLPQEAPRDFAAAIMDVNG